MTSNNPTLPKQAAPKSTIHLAWTGWLVIFIVISIVTSLVLRLLTPVKKSLLVLPSQPSFIKTNFNETQTKFGSVVYSGPAVDLPENLVILAANKSTANSQKITSEIIAKYSLQPHPKSQNIWLKDEFALVRNPTEATYQFSENLINAQTGGLKETTETRLSKSEAIALSQKLLTELKLDTQFQVYELGMEYFVMEGYDMERIPNQVSNYTHVLVPFIQKYQNYPILTENQKTNQISFLLTYAGQVSHINYPIYSVEVGQEITTLKTLSLQQALKQIEFGLGSIVNATSQTIVPFEIENIDQADFKSVKIEYRVDAETNTAIPYFRFEGNLTNSAKNSFQASIITPAVATTPSESLQ